MQKVLFVFLLGTVFGFTPACVAAQTKQSVGYEVRRINYIHERVGEWPTTICAAPDGTLWMGTSDGLYRFDGFGIERLHLIPQYFPVTHLQADTTYGDKLMWVCGPSGVAIFNLKSGCRLSEQDLGLPFNMQNYYVAMTKSIAGFYWLLCGEQLFRLNKSGSMQYECVYEGTIPSCLTPRLVNDPIQPNGVWIFPKSYKAYYFSDKVVTRLDIPFSKIPPNAPLGLAGLVSTDQGLAAWGEGRSVYYIDTTRKVLHLCADPESITRLFPAFREVDLFAKQKGLLSSYLNLSSGLQVISTNLGMFIVKKKCQAFKVIKDLVGEEMRGMYVQNEQDWWAGTYNGLYRGHIGTGQCLRYEDTRVWGTRDFLALAPGLLFLAIESSTGVGIWDVEQEEILEKTLPRQAVKKGPQLSLCRDSRGIIWMGGYNGVSWAETASLPVFQPYSFFQSGKPLKISNVLALLADDQAGIWVGWDKGLLRLAFNPVTRSYEQRDSATALNGITVSHLYRDRYDRLWIATKGSGLACLNLKAPEKGPKWYNSEHGLCNNFVCRIESSHDDQVLWLSTHKGLARLDVQKGTFHNFYEDSGFYGNEFNSAASAAFPNGTLMFGGISGLTFFHPDSVRVPDFQHQTNVISAKVFNASSGKLEAMALTQNGTLQLPAYIRYLELQLSTSEWLRPSATRIRYRLRGISDIWSYTNGEQTIKLIGVPSGQYSFEVQSMPLDGHIGKIYTLPVYIASPYYETLWFKAVVVLFFLGVTYYFYWHRIRQVLREQRIRRQIADDLHDDIGNKLNLIGILTQKVANTPSGKMPKPQDMSNLTDLSRTALRTLHTMIWSVDADKDSLSNLIERMQDFADDFLRPLNIAFQFTIQETMPIRNISMQVRHHTIMVYQELLTNMVKYALPKNVTIGIRTKGDTLYIHIQNHRCPEPNPSFEFASAQRGNESIKRRLERMKADIHREETESHQSIILTVPLQS
jgi:ligand-binding sensor domain-containing protein/two-component sensor histidine kinase